MLAYQGEAEAHGAVVAFGSPLERREVDDDGIALEVGGDEPMRSLAAMLVNAAGLLRRAVARALAGPRPARSRRRLSTARATTSSLAGRSPFRI